MPSGCPGLQALDPLCQAAGLASGVLADGAGSVLQAMTQWVVDGATWLLDQIGDVLATTTSVDLGAGWFESHYQVMLGILGVVVVPMFLGAVLQAVLRQDGGILVRAVLVHLPLALVLAGGAIKTVQLALAATDGLSSLVAAGSGTDVRQALSVVVAGLGAASLDSSVPAFVLLLVALLVALGALALWVELLLRAAAVYVAVLFLPLALGSLVWPAISHLCRRLVDTLAALVLSKFVIVAILSLAVGALASGTGGSSTGSPGGGVATVLAGAALLLLAAFSPYTLLRLVPLVDAGAISHLQEVRHRAQRVGTTVPVNAANFALRQARIGSFDPGEPGTGRAEHYEAPGGEGAGGSGLRVPSSTEIHGDGAHGDRAAAGGTGAQAPGSGRASSIPMWRSDRSSTEAFDAVISGRVAPPEPTPNSHSVLRSEPSEDPWPDRGRHVIGRDAMGPVIKWIPPEDVDA